MTSIRVNLKKTAVYTNVNGDIVSYTLTTAKIKKVILPSNTLPNVHMLLSNIILVRWKTFIFAVLLPIYGQFSYHDTLRKHQWFCPSV